MESLGRARWPLRLAGERIALQDLELLDHPLAQIGFAVLEEFVGFRGEAHLEHQANPNCFLTSFKLTVLPSLKAMSAASRSLASSAVRMVSGSTMCSLRYSSSWRISRSSLSISCSAIPPLSLRVL